MCDKQRQLKEARNHIGTYKFLFHKTATVVKPAHEGEVMVFQNFKHMLERPLVVHADFECSLIKADEPGIRHKHEPNSAAFYNVNTFNPSRQLALVIRW